METTDSGRTTVSDAEETVLISELDSFEDGSSQNERRRNENISVDCIWREIRLLVDLTLPTIILQIGFTMSPFLIASFVGRKFGGESLAGFSLANLTGNMLSMSLLQGFFSASDTLSPRAFSAGNHKEVGLIAMRSFFASLMLIIPVNAILVPTIEPILIYTGQDPVAARYAASWYRVYALSLPFYAVYNSTWKFLAAQNIMKPIVYICLISCGIVLPVSLEILTESIGFVGSAYSFLIFQIFQAVLLLSYLWWKHPHVTGTWPGKKNWRHAFRRKAFREFLYLSAGGMAANLEWLAWEAISLIVGQLGVLPLSVHTIPTQVIMACYMIPFGVGVALSVRLGAMLHKSVRRAKILAVGTLLVSAILLALLSYLLYVFRFTIYAIFTDEKKVLEGTEKIWWMVCLYNFTSSMFGVLSGIATGMGMQWTLAVVNISCMWFIGVPMVYYRGVVCDGGLEAVWVWINIPYLIIDAAMVITFITMDWGYAASYNNDVDPEDEDKDQMETESISEELNLSHQDVVVYGSTNSHNQSPSVLFV